MVLVLVWLLVGGNNDRSTDTHGLLAVHRSAVEATLGAAAALMLRAALSVKR